MPITELLNTSKTAINFKDFFPQSQYYKQWRWRIEKIEVFLLDQADQVIPSVDVGLGYGISLGITFPNIFNDTDSTKDVHTFFAQPFYCRSTYETIGK